jgi:regulatory protein
MVKMMTRLVSLRSEPDEEQKLTVAELKKIAIDLLSRRDQSCVELKQKLQQKGGALDDVVNVIDWCTGQNYQSDSRYCAMLVRSKVNKGYGFAVVSQAAREQGIDRELLTQTIDELEIDWFALAMAQYQKKFADKPIKDFQDKQKRMGFLQRRGFTSGQIQYALQHQDS